MIEGSSLGNLRKYETKENIHQSPDLNKFGKISSMQVRLCKNGIEKKTFGVHQIILPCFLLNIENKPTIDHIDRLPSNNILSNLRYATPTEEQHNKDKREVETSSSYLGVSFNKGNRKWDAYISLKNGTLEHLGYFNNELDAVFARDFAEVELWKEFAHTNIV
jgi:hypothetical protein